MESSSLELKRFIGTFYKSIRLNREKNTSNYFSPFNKTTEAFLFGLFLFQILFSTRLKIDYFTFFLIVSTICIFPYNRSRRKSSLSPNKPSKDQIWSSPTKILSVHQVGTFHPAFMSTLRRKRNQSVNPSDDFRNLCSNIFITEQISSSQWQNHQSCAFIREESLVDFERRPTTQCRLHSHQSSNLSVKEHLKESSVKQLTEVNFLCNEEASKTGKRKQHITHARDKRPKKLRVSLLSSERLAWLRCFYRCSSWKSMIDSRQWESPLAIRPN